MLTAWFIAMVLSALTVAIHYEAMHGVTMWVPRLCQNFRCRVVIAVFCLLVAHVVEIWLFAGGHYAAINWFALGELKGEFSGAIREYVYYSAITYTSVGYGDITPAGEVRIIAGLEGLTGLLMVAWSAAFTAFFLQRRWEDEAAADQD